MRRRATSWQKPPRRWRNRSDQSQSAKDVRNSTEDRLLTEHRPPRQARLSQIQHELLALASRAADHHGPPFRPLLLRQHRIAVVRRAAQDNGFASSADALLARGRNSYSGRAQYFENAFACRDHQASLTARQFDHIAASLRIDGGRIA